MPISADNFPILAGIQPAKLARKRATFSVAHRATELGHLLGADLSAHPFNV